MFYSLNWWAWIAAAIAVYVIYHFLGKMLSALWGGNYQSRSLADPIGIVMSLLSTFILYILTIKAENHTCMADGIKFAMMVSIGIILPAQYFANASAEKPFMQIIKDGILFCVLMIIAGAILGALS